MSTPVQQLPATAPSQAPPAKPDEDPTIRNVLEEMELEVAAATAAQKPPPPPPRVPPPPAPVHTVAAMPSYPHPFLHAGDFVEEEMGWWDPLSAKRAAIAAVVAMALFYPKTLHAVFDRVPALQRFASYDHLIRAALLALVIYVLLTRLDM